MTGQFIRIKKTPLSISFGVLVILCGLTVFFFLGRANYDSQGVNLTNFKTVKIVDVCQRQTNTAEQLFTAKNNNLNYLSVAIKNEKNSNTLNLVLATWPEGHIIASQPLVVMAMAGYQYVSLEFPPLNNSKDKTFKLTADTTNCQNMQLITVAKDRYPEGRLFLNQSGADQVMVFNFHYYSSNLWQVLLNRLPLYKPWLFKYPASFIILFMIYFLSVAELIYFLIKKYFTQTGAE